LKAGRQQPPIGSRIATAIAGEFFVAGELARRGWIVTLTAKNTPVVDILASRVEGDVHARIQVKTRTIAYRYAHRVGKLRLAGQRDFIVLVDLRRENESPLYWIIPATKALSLVHNEQIRTREIDEFLDRWDLLEKPERVP
jgi:hypothetical protein